MFELWDLTSRNVTGLFETKAAALAAVRAAAELRGRDYAAAFALIREDQRGNSRTIAKGPKLIELALQTRAAASLP